MTKLGQWRTSTVQHCCRAAEVLLGGENTEDETGALLQQILQIRVLGTVPLLPVPPPPLFNIFLQPLLKIIKQHVLQLHNYADDPGIVPPTHDLAAEWLFPLLPHSGE